MDEESAYELIYQHEYQTHEYQTEEALYLSAVLPVDHTYDLLPECGWKNFAQKAQKFVLCTGHIKDGGFLFCHNICDEAADIFRGHAVLFIMFHAADTSGNSSVIVFVTEDVFLA